MNEDKLMQAYPLLDNSAPPDWVELKVLFQKEDSIARFITFYKLKTNSEWVRGDFGGFDLLDFFDSIKGKFNENTWSQLEIIFDRQKNLTYRIFNEDPNIFG